MFPNYEKALTENELLSITSISNVDYRPPESTCHCREVFVTDDVMVRWVGMEVFEQCWARVAQKFIFSSSQMFVFVMRAEWMGTAILRRLWVNGHSNLTTSMNGWAQQSYDKYEWMGTAIARRMRVLKSTVLCSTLQHGNNEEYALANNMLAVSSTQARSEPLSWVWD